MLNNTVITTNLMTQKHDKVAHKQRHVQLLLCRYTEQPDWAANGVLLKFLFNLKF